MGNIRKKGEKKGEKEKERKEEKKARRISLEEIEIYIYSI